jgi:hypothetical protein
MISIVTSLLAVNLVASDRLHNRLTDRPRAIIGDTYLVGTFSFSATVTKYNHYFSFASFFTGEST